MWGTIASFFKRTPPSQEELKEAAESLHEYLKNDSWYRCIAIATGKLIVYTRTDNISADWIETWKDCPVEFIKCGDTVAF
jgi:hypothetical protein